MCTQRTPEPRRLSAPPMCIRHELSAAVQTSALVSSTHRALSDTIALDTSAFFNEKVPPNPQHSIRFGQIDEREAPHGLEQPPRLVAEAQRTQRVAGRVQRDGVRVRGADVGYAELLDQELGEFEDARKQVVHSPDERPGRPIQPPSSDSAREASRHRTPTECRSPPRPRTR